MSLTYASEFIEREEFVHHKIENILYHDISIRIAILINIIIMTVLLLLLGYSSYAEELRVHFVMRGHWLVIALFVLLYLSIGKVYDAFKISYSGVGEMVYSQMLSLFEVNVIMYFVAFLLIRKVPAVLPMLAVFVV